ncbi:MAG: hypothetical protein C4321_07280 [Chloroflexota bacterium]
MRCIQSVYTVLGAFAMLSLMAPAAQAQQQQTNNSPLMTGSAEAPKTVAPATLFAYSLTQTDSDTYMGSLLADTKKSLGVVVIRSMQPGTSLAAPRTGGASATWIWDVSGKSLAAIGNFIDTLKLPTN